MKCPISLMYYPLKNIQYLAPLLVVLYSSSRVSSSNPGLLYGLKLLFKPDVEVVSVVDGVFDTDDGVFVADDGVFDTDDGFIVESGEFMTEKSSKLFFFT